MCIDLIIYTTHRNGNRFPLALCRGQECLWEAPVYETSVKEYISSWPQVFDVAGAFGNGELFD